MEHDAPFSFVLNVQRAKDRGLIGSLFSKFSEDAQQNIWRCKYDERINLSKSVFDKGEEAESTAASNYSSARKGFLLEQTLQLIEQVNGNEFLIRKGCFGIIAQALKTGFATGIVNVTDRLIQLDQLIFLGKKILPIQPALSAILSSDSH